MLANDLPQGDQKSCVDGHVMSMDGIEDFTLLRQASQ
jgi:hypothetical protein